MKFLLDLDRNRSTIPAEVQFAKINCQLFFPANYRVENESKRKNRKKNGSYSTAEKLWNMPLMVIQIEVNILWTVSEDKGVLDFRGWIKYIQITDLFKSAKIYWRVLETCGKFAFTMRNDQLNLVWKTCNGKNTNTTTTTFWVIVFNSSNIWVFMWFSIIMLI